MRARRCGKRSAARKLPSTRRNCRQRSRTRDYPSPNGLEGGNENVDKSKTCERRKERTSRISSRKSTRTKTPWDRDRRQTLRARSRRATIFALKMINMAIQTANEKQQMEGAYERFVGRYPEYAETTAIDRLRSTDYRRLDEHGQVYLDYTGGSLYAESQLEQHLVLLRSGVFGNPHSTRSEEHTSELQSL